MLKKLFYAGVFLVASLTASAGTYTVYQNGKLGENLNPGGWWNDSYSFTAASPDGTDAQVFEFKPAGTSGYGNASMGIQMVQPGNTGSLHSATLSFKYYALGTGDYTIRLTGKGQVEAEEYKFTVTKDNAGKWNDVSYVVANQQPTIANQWKEDANRGQGHVFSVILDNGTEESVIYFNDIVYTNTDDNWVAPDYGETVPQTVPMPAKSADDILSFLTPYGKIAYGVPYWGQSTQYSLESIDGKDVIHLTNFNYQGLDGFDFDISGYTHMHIDYWTPDGNTFSFCPISLEPTTCDAPRWYAPEVKQKEWNSYDAPISEFNANLNLNNIKQLKFDDGGSCEAYITNIYFWKEDNSGTEQPEQPEQPGEAGATYHGKLEGNFGSTPFTMTYTATWNENGTVTFDANISPTVDGLVAQMFANGEHIGDFTNNGNGNFTMTTSAAYEAGTKPFAFYAAFAGGNTEQIALDYVVGSANEGTEEPDPEEPTEPEEPGDSKTFSGVIESSYSQEFNGVTTEYFYTLPYSISYTESKTLVVKASLIWTAGKPEGAIDQMYADVLRGDATVGNEYSLARIDGEFETRDIFENGDELTIKFRLNCAGPTIVTLVPYVVGSTGSETPAEKVVLKAKAENITKESAEIAYEVSAPEGYVVTVTYRKADEPEAIVATESPIKVENLEASTSYTYILSATAVKEETTLTSDDVKVEFTTLRDNTQAVARYEITNGILKNAFYVGEDASTMRRELPITYDAEVLYNVDKTVTINYTPITQKPITGLVHEVNIGDEWSGKLAALEDGSYSYTTRRQFEEDENVTIFHWPAADGVGDRFDLAIFKAGESNERVAYGEPVNMVLNVKENEGLVDQKLPFTVYLVDENGNFILDREIDLSVDVENSVNATIDGFTLTLNEPGEATLIAQYEDLMETAVFKTIVSASSVNLALEKPVTLSEFGNNGQAVTDNNEGTEAEFDCSTTQEHTISVDLGANYKLELITLVWEGASAKQYSIRLEDGENPAEIRTMGVYTDVTINEDNCEGGAGLTLRKNYRLDNVPARFITITTKSAFDPGWGIKLKQLYAYGNPTPTAVDDIAVDGDDAAPVEYYNLQGVRVDNPSNGLYIRRQGNSTMKVLIK